MRIFVSLCLCLLAGVAQAQNCPDFYRFVDFGLTGKDGKLYRGGTTLRAESFDGEPIIIFDKSRFLPITDIAKDGHGNPIPIVQQVYYDPALLSVGLDELSVSTRDDMQSIAAKSVDAHQQNLAKADATITRGTDFICVTAPQQTSLSCQIVSPYPSNVDLVISCDADKCAMPVLAATDRLAISARWAINQANLDDPNSVASDMIVKVRQIYDFLKPLSADL